MSDQPSPPDYKVYRSRPRLLGRREPAGDGLLGGLRGPGGGRGAPGGWRARLTWKRVLKWVAVAVVGWIAVSLVLFLVSAQIEQSKVSGQAESALDSGGFPLTGASTVLVLGSDQRPKGSKEGGASTSGPSRSDSILLMRVGAGHAGRLSIPRDTVVDIPGHGRDKINAAYAIGGPALAITTVKQFLGVKINHLIEVNFTNFPKFIDALGGVDYTGGCVVSKINGGYKNGGITLRFKRGTHHLTGKQALALARTRHNACNPRENDLSRARRQQKILSAIKSKLISPTTFFRLPLVSWDAPKAIRTDMSGFSLLGLFASVEIGGSPKTAVLKGTPAPINGEAGLVVSPADKEAAVRRFLNG
jgi:LCP family protein required for cell wall assembly